MKLGSQKAGPRQASAKQEAQLAKAVRDVPFLLPFELRAQIFRHLIRTSAEEVTLYVGRQASCS
jgi:hypothetical protein